MKIESPKVIFECPYCGNRKEDATFTRDFFPGKPPLELDKWFKAKEEGRVCHEDGIPLKEGEVIPAICPNCIELGMPNKILGDIRGYETP